MGFIIIGVFLILTVIVIAALCDWDFDSSFWFVPLILAFLFVTGCYFAYVGITMINMPKICKQYDSGIIKKCYIKDTDNNVIDSMYVYKSE